METCIKTKRAIIVVRKTVNMMMESETQNRET